MDDYVNQLLQEAGVPDSLDPDVKTELVAGLTTRVIDLINRRMIEALPLESAQEFESLVDNHSDDPAVMQSFMEQKLPSKDKIVAAALLEFRALYLGDKA